MNTLPSRSITEEPNLPPELRDEGGSRLARRAILVLTALFSAVLLWALIAPLEEVAVASGQLVPAASVSEVHHLEGGIVTDVLVAEGDRVQRGETLLALGPQRAGADLGQLRARAANLKMKRLRLTALIEEKDPDFQEFAARYPDLAEEQRSAHDEAAANARDRRREAALTIDRLTQQIANAREELQSLEQQISFQDKQVDIRRESFEKGYTSRHQLLQAQSALEETRQRRVAVRGRIDELINRREEARVKLRGLRTEQRSQWAEARAEVIANLSEVEETLGKHRDRVARLSVKSPVTGTVQSLNYKADGEVIKPGALVAEIVPEGDPLLAQVELSPRDIGHVHTGDPAELTLSNYDPNVVGILKGEVRSISPTTVEDRKGRFYYRVDIALAQDALGHDGHKFPLLPGMTLQAKIRTGEKTLARYMLKPVFSSLDTAFAER